MSATASGTLRYVKYRRVQGRWGSRLASSAHRPAVYAQPPARVNQNRYADAPMHRNSAPHTTSKTHAGGMRGLRPDARRMPPGLSPPPAADTPPQTPTAPGRATG